MHSRRLERDASLLQRFLSSRKPTERVLQFVAHLEAFLGTAGCAIDVSFHGYDPSRRHVQ